MNTNRKITTEVKMKAEIAEQIRESKKKKIRYGKREEKIARRLDIRANLYLKK